MKRKTVEQRAYQKTLEATLQSVLDILETDDGKSFEEKKAQAIRMLTEKQDTLLANTLVNMAIAEKSASQIRDSFWSFGEEIELPNGILLRKVKDADRAGFLSLKRIYSPTAGLLKQEAYQNMVWREHTEQKSLAISIEHNGIYAGYCGIQDLSKKVMEISIELLPEKTAQGIGFAAVCAMLDELQDRLGVLEYRIRIEPTNLASQRLFEKLGAVPNGISEFWLHKPEDLDELENENESLIDAALVSVAEKFSVEPRTLLSHVLEYKLIWH